MAAVRNKKGRFSRTGVVLRAKKIGELKTSVVKDKPLIHTVEENQDEPHRKLLKKREREIGYHMEGLSEESCQEALTEEGTLSSRSYSATSDSTQNPLPIEIDVSYDAGWQMRGSGRSYNSFSGHGSLIGRKSGKVIDFETRIKKCRICEHAYKFGWNPKKLYKHR